MEARRETLHTSKYSSVMTNVMGNIIAPLGSFSSLYNMFVFLVSCSHVE